MLIMHALSLSEMCEFWINDLEYYYVSFTFNAEVVQNRPNFDNFPKH